MTQHIHETQQVQIYGTTLEDATAAVLLIHGRGASAPAILEIAPYLKEKVAAALPDEKIAFIAPQAAGNTWYPRSGFGPLAANEPFLSSANNTITLLLEKIKEAGIPAEKTFVGGFSQGACLMSEYVVTHPAPYAGVFIHSGALLGPMDRERDYPGSLDGVPVFIGGVDHDSWVTVEQFDLTERVLAGMGASVTRDVIAGSDHTIRPAELDATSAMMVARLGA